MRFETGILIRPGSPLAGPSPNPVADARERWRRALTTQPGVLSFEFARSLHIPPIENPEDAAAASLAPLDVTIVWDSEESAPTLFGDDRLFEYLNGCVAGRPAYRARGNSCGRARS